MTLRTVRYDDAAWQLVPKTMARALFECAEALRDLLQDTQHVEHECDDDVFCPVKNGRAALARLDGEPTMPDGYQPLRADVERLRERDGRIWPGFALLTQRELTRAINALGIDSRAGMPDYVLSDAIWAHLHGMPAKSLPAQPRRPYGTATLSEYGVIPECDGPKPSAQEPRKMTPAMWLGEWAAALANAPEPPPAQEPMGAEQIASACYTYRHDFGLLPEAERHLLMAEARRWAAAFGIGKGGTDGAC